MSWARSSCWLSRMYDSTDFFQCSKARCPYTTKRWISSLFGARGGAKKLIICAVVEGEDDVEEEEGEGEGEGGGEEEEEESPMSTKCNVGTMPR